MQPFQLITLRLDMALTLTTKSVVILIVAVLAFKSRTEAQRSLELYTRSICMLSSVSEAITLFYG